jgi:hypothetical protein
MGTRRCSDCLDHPVMRCGRCQSTRCERHALPRGQRCSACEREWREDAPIRRAAKLIFAPSAALFTGGALFALLMPVSIGGAIGAVIMCAFACGSAVGAGAGTCSLVDRSARAMFLRERASGLPPARLLPAPRHR